MATKRVDERKAAELRPIKLNLKYLKSNPASCLIQWGDTHVLCTATVEEGVPPFMRDKGEGWVTAEYGMLPASSSQRIRREVTRGKQGGRTMEIQRLIGRSLRSIVDMKALGERTVLIDCDVIQADGGTRCASITGAFVALVLAMRTLLKDGLIKKMPVREFISAVSVGIVKGVPVCDLNYIEDSSADVDMNIVMTGKGKYVEVQGTAEHNPFSGSELESMLKLGRSGNRQLQALQKKALGGALVKGRR